VSDELFKALHDMALIENRSISNLAETALNSFFKIKPKK
jgi:predicted transcriptional regulator